MYAVSMNTGKIIKKQTKLKWTKMSIRVRKG